MSSQHRAADTRQGDACPLIQTRDLQKHYPGG